jgi:hypothetical protein
MRTTRIGMVITILAVLVAVKGIAIAQRDTDSPFSFVISAPSEVKSGFGVTVGIKFTNTSNKVVFLEGMEAPYVAIIRDAHGNPSSDTEKGRKVKDKQRKTFSPLNRGSGFMASLQPGESITQELIVSDLYDMSRPGKYSIQLQRFWNDRLVPSNTVKIRIIPQ